MSRTKVLFLCSSNSCRSQMAEAFLREFGGEDFEAYSAGLEPRDIHPMTRTVMAEVGIGLDGQHAKDVMTYLGTTLFHYLVTVCDRADHDCPVCFPGVTQRLHWAFEDPAAFVGSGDAKLDKFREVRDQIAEQIQNWVAEVNAERHHEWPDVASQALDWRTRALAEREATPHSPPVCS
jgi:arsenate reductase (thioredoxin)